MLWRITDAESSYHALSVTVNKRFSRSFQLQSAYTFSKSTDDASTWDDTRDFGESDRSGYGLRKDHGLSSFDVRRVWTTNFTLDLPDQNLTGLVGTLLGGWRLSGIVRFNDGFPLNPSAQQSRNRIRINGINTDFSMSFVDGPRLDLLPEGDHNPIRAQDPDEYIDVSQFALPATNCLSRDPRSDTPEPFPCEPSLTGGLVGPEGAFLGNLGRNVLISPGVANMDVALRKEGSIELLGEAVALHFRAELFNLFNRPNFGSPELVLYTRTGTVQAGAGQIKETRVKARQVQLALRVVF
jgi:hypothetical protein